MIPELTARGCYELGVSHLKRGEHERAAASFTEAIRLDPDLTNAYVGRALAYRSLGDDAAAAEDDRAAQDRGGAKPPHDGLLILCPPIFAVGERVDRGALAAFADAAEAETQRYFRQSPPAHGVDLNVACALLPGGATLVDIQAWPAVPVEWLAERVRALPRPAVSGGPVAFVRSTTVNGGCPGRREGSWLPFASIITAGGVRPLEELLVAAGDGRGRSLWDRLRRALGGSS